MRKREIVSFSIVKLNAFTSLKIFETRSKIALKPIEIQAKNRENIRSERRQKNWRAITCSISSSTIRFQFLSIEENFTKEVYPPLIKQGGGKNEASSYLISSKRTKFIFESKLLLALKKRNYISALNSNFFPRAGPVLRIFFFLCSSFTSRSSRATNALASSNRSKVV